MIDLKKPLQTRGNEDHPIPWTWKKLPESMEVVIYAANGNQIGCVLWPSIAQKIIDSVNQRDLINVPEKPKKHKVWVKFCPDSRFPSGLSAVIVQSTTQSVNVGSLDTMHPYPCIACVEVEFQEGEGL